MKKTLIAVAALSAMACSAMAAQVTVYGKVDQGLQVNHSKVTDQESTTTWAGKSGISSGSRWGLKGTEEIAEGYVVGFKLESGFDGFTGKSGQGNRLFGRDAYLSLDTPFGQFVAGRTGTLTDGCTGDIISGPSSPFGTSYGIAAATSNTFSDHISRTDNAVRYVSPKFAGFQLHAEYANMNSGKTASTKQRYGGIGVSYANGPLYVAIAGETVREAASSTADNPKLLSLAANYDFGVVKVYGGYQYAKDTQPAAALLEINEELGDAFTPDKYHAGTLGISAPIGNGTLMASIAYRDGDAEILGVNTDWKQMFGAIGYKYNLSKRTYLYTDIAYTKVTIEPDNVSKITSKTTQFNVGLCHNF